MNLKLKSLAVAGVIAVAGLAGASSASAAPACPGEFNVLHNDSIGKLKLPQGPYTISVKRMTCVDASSNFARFLQRPAGDLPDGWKLFARRGKFVQRTQGKAFLVAPANTPNNG
ncbi:MAG: hypothetical protein U0R24_10400 [Solirubrobacterales bacterium]